MATRQISILRSSVTSVKPFESVVAALSAAVGHPDMDEFARKIGLAKKTTAKWRALFSQCLENMG